MSKSNEMTQWIDPNKWRERGVIALLGALSVWLLYLGISTPSQATQAKQAARMTATAQATQEAAEPRYRFTPTTTNISAFVIGDIARVDHNPTGEVDISLGETIDADNWRVLTLSAAKPGGGRADVVLARPLWWLERQSAKVGGEVYITVPECGIDGHATVHAIDPCPPIPTNLPANARVVIGTFKHHGAQVIDLTFESTSAEGQSTTETLGATPNHPFWSEDRRDYVRADALKPGETLRTLDGFAKVVSIKPRAEPETVYNIEVFGDHLYHVGDAGALVHNALPCDDGIGEYRHVGGHHIHAKAGFKGHPKYDHRSGLSISQAYMLKRRWNHSRMTTKQQELFAELRRSGRPNTLKEQSRIAVESLVAGGASQKEARALVARSLYNLRSQGVRSVSHVPWSRF